MALGSCVGLNIDVTVLIVLGASQARLMSMPMLVWGLWRPLSALCYDFLLLLQLAFQRGLITAEERARVFGVMRSLGLAIWHEVCTLDVLMQVMSSPTSSWHVLQAVLHHTVLAYILPVLCSECFSPPITAIPVLYGAVQKCRSDIFAYLGSCLLLWLNDVCLLGPGGHHTTARWHPASSFHEWHRRGCLCE